MPESNQPRSIILFANTKWFLCNFKLPLILYLANLYPSKNIYALYLRDGPTTSSDVLDDLSRSGVKLCRFDQFVTRKIAKGSHPFGSSLLLVYTIGPILLAGSFLFLLSSRSCKACVTLEGLGRLFSSERIYPRLIKRIVESLYRVLFRSVYCRIFVLNYTDYSYILERRISPFHAVTVIPGTGVSLSRFTPSSLAFCKRNKQRQSDDHKDQFVFSYIGRVSHEKGFYRFIAAVQCLKNLSPLHSGFAFLVACPQSDLDAFSESDCVFFSSLGISLRSYVPDPILFYSNTDVVVIPTMYGEGLSRVALECASLGLPVVAFDNMGVDGVIVNGLNGIVLSSRSPYSLAMAMTEIHSQYASFKEASLLQRDLIASRFSDDASLQSVKSVILSLIEEM